MREDPEGIAAGLAEPVDGSDVVDLVGRRMRAGDAVFVADLGLALWHTYGAAAEPPRQFASLCTQVLRLLTITPGAVAEAVRFISVAVDRRRIRYAASLLASAYPPRELGVVFAAGRSEELRACLVREIVPRGCRRRLAVLADTDTD